MEKFDVKVVGARRPRRRFRPLTSIWRIINGTIRAVLMRPRLTLATGFVAFIAFVGTPHIGWDYQCRHVMNGIGTCRAASWCAYYGFQGRRIYRPETYTTCGLIKLLPPDWNQLILGQSQ